MWHAKVCRVRSIQQESMLYGFLRGHTAALPDCINRTFYVQNHFCISYCLAIITGFYNE